VEYHISGSEKKMIEKLRRGKIKKRSAVIPYIDSEQILIFFLVSRFFFDAVSIALDRIFGSFLIWHMAIWAIQLVFLISAWIVILKKPFALLLAELLSVFITCWGFFAGNINKADGTWLHYAIYQVVFFVPMAITVYRIKNKRRLLEAYYKVAALSAVMVIAALYIARSRTSAMVYDQYAGYVLLMACLIMGTSFLEKKQWSDLLLPIFSCMAIILYCSRGPLLVVAVYVLIVLLMNKDMKAKTKLFLALTGIFAMILLVLLYPLMLELLTSFAERIGIHSRTLYLLKEEPIYWSGRDTILGKTIELIKQNPILGHGAYGWKELGTYPHNIFFELILAFGIPLGFILCLVWLFIYIRGFLCRDADQQRLIFIFGCYSLQLLWSGSLLGDEFFFVFVGLSMAGSSRLRMTPKKYTQLS